ncbi:MAG: hypothetical protein ACLR7U_05235 [Ruthenibacterium lactatiformans]
MGRLRQRRARIHRRRVLLAAAGLFHRLAHGWRTLNGVQEFHAAGYPAPLGQNYAAATVLSAKHYTYGTVPVGAAAVTIYANVRPRHPTASLSSGPAHRLWAERAAHMDTTCISRRPNAPRTFAIIWGMFVLPCGHARPARLRLQSSFGFLEVSIWHDSSEGAPARRPRPAVPRPQPVFSTRRTVRCS